MVFSILPTIWGHTTIKKISPCRNTAVTWSTASLTPNPIKWNAELKIRRKTRLFSRISTRRSLTGLLGKRRRAWKKHTPSPRNPAYGGGLDLRPSGAPRGHTGRSYWQGGCPQYHPDRSQVGHDTVVHWPAHKAWSQTPLYMRDQLLFSDKGAVLASSIKKAEWQDLNLRPQYSKEINQDILCLYRLFQPFLLRKRCSLALLSAYSPSDPNR